MGLIAKLRSVFGTTTPAPPTSPPLILQPTEAPDMSKPSLPGLVWLLRHPDYWPDGFEYSWTITTHCAMGLAQKYWGLEGRPSAAMMSRAFDITGDEAISYFYHWHGSKPNHVADFIEKDLARRPVSHSDTPEFV